MPSLTSLRFFAALLVVIYHCSRYFEPMGGLAPLAGFGYTGVSFFFILSGFVLAWSSRPDDTKQSFYLRRFARVWPLHALTTIIAIPAAIAAGIAVVWPGLPFVLSLTQAWLPPGDFRYAFNGVSWSLSCEAFFYLLFPALLQIIGRQRRLLLACSVVLAGMVLIAALGIAFIPERALGYVLYTMPAFRLGEFMVGICLAVAVQRGWTPRFTLRHALIGSVLAYAVLMGGTLLTLGGPSVLPYVVADLWMLPAFAAVIVSAAVGDIRGDGKPLWSPALVRLGQWSFALYLVHELVIKISDRFIDPLPLLPASVGSLLVLAVSVGLSGLLFEFFERPVEKRLRSWALNRERVGA